MVASFQCAKKGGQAGYVFHPVLQVLPRIVAVDLLDCSASSFLQIPTTLLSCSFNLEPAISWDQARVTNSLQKI